LACDKRKENYQKLLPDKKSLEQEYIMKVSGPEYLAYNPSTYTKLVE